MLRCHQSRGALPRFGVIGPETQLFHGADGEVRLANGSAQAPLAAPAVLAKSQGTGRFSVEFSLT
jgi:hypothetical protein